MVGSKDLPPSHRSWPSVFIRNQFFSKPQWPPAETDLSGKTAIVTGANQGLGHEVAIQLLQLRLSRLVIGVRSVEKGEAAAAKLRAQHPLAEILVWQVDMCNYDSIRSFARRVEEQLPHIEYVLLNAGISAATFRIVSPGAGTAGHEETLQVNYLSTMLLALLLLPILKKKKTWQGEAPKLSIVSSALTLAAKLPNRNAVPLLSSFDDPANFNSDDAYQGSKLLAEMFLWKLVDHVSAEDVVVNLPDPAWTKGTELVRETSESLPAPVRALMNFTGRPVKEGASCLVDGLVVKGPESHGCFLMNWKIHP